MQDHHNFLPESFVQFVDLNQRILVYNVALNIVVPNVRTCIKTLDVLNGQLSCNILFNINNNCNNYVKYT
jgi:hypothetical protein